MLVHFLFSLVYAHDSYIVLFKERENTNSYNLMASSEDNVDRTISMFGVDDRIEKKLINGYKAYLSDRTVEKLKNDPEVELVEKDEKVTIASFHEEEIREYNDNNPFYTLAESFILQKSAPWGISRISGHKSDYEYLEGAGKNVNVYVLDTGVDVNHKEFEGRASWGFNAFKDSKDEDEHGHGTHCAGIIAGKIYGIAKDANIIAVKILNSRGEGMISGIIEGIDFVMKDHEKKINDYYDQQGKNYLTRITEKLGAYFEDFLEKENYKVNTWFKDIKSIFKTQKVKPKAVVNMSVGGTKSNALNLAIKYATKYLNIHFSTAAGNEHKNACNFSPASSGSSMTIGASSKLNTIASFSNVGECVDVYAPGTEILSSWPGNRARFASGTSMAAPHVSGIMAVYIGLADFEPEELKQRILKDAENVIKDSETNESFLPFGFNLFTKTNSNMPMASLKKLYERIKTN